MKYGDDRRAQRWEEGEGRTLVVENTLAQVSVACLMAPDRAILRYYRCDTPYRVILFREVSTPQSGAITPLALSFTKANICTIPYIATYRTTIV